MRNLDTLLGTGIGDPWLVWADKVRRVPPGVGVLDVLGRRDWPGDDITWGRFVALQDQARRICQADTGSGWSNPQAPAPQRIPAGEWRSLSALAPTAALDRVGEWVSEWHAHQREAWRGLLLVGAVGTGKTAIACALAHDSDGDSFWPVTDLIDHLMDSYRSNSFGARFDALARRRLLILDDLGAERDTDGQTDLVVKLIDRRHRQRRVTVITTNLKSAQRTARYGQRIESRLQQMCEVVPVTGADRRAA